MNLELIFDIVLIVIIVYTFVLCAIALRGFIKEGFLRQRAFKFALPFGLLFIAYLLYSLVFHRIGPSEWAQVFLVLGLVVVTGYYALVAFRQANASIKMADEMKNARSPFITMQWGTADRNNKKISANLENEGFGPALNLKCYLSHKQFDFNYKSCVYTTFKVGQTYKLSLPSQDFDFKAWNGLSINCDYGGILGDKFRSILRCESEGNRSLEIIQLDSGDSSD